MKSMKDLGDMYSQQSFIDLPGKENRTGKFPILESFTEATVEQTFESEYFRHDKEIFYELPARIMFSIGQTFHKHTLSR